MVGAAWVRHTGLVVGDRELPEVIISVLAEYRGHSVGTELMNGLTALARQRALPGLCLRVSEENPAAIRAYERAGFQVQDDRIDGGLLMVWQASPQAQDCRGDSFATGESLRS